MSTTISHATVENHLHILRITSVLTWLLTVALLYISSNLPLFDSSPRVILQGKPSTWAEFFAFPLLRWDAFHFGHIAKEGYLYEYEWAFFPGGPLVMKAGACILHFIRTQTPSQDVSWAGLFIAGGLVSCFCGTTTTLYRLTLHHFGSPSMAFLTCLLALLPSSPATLRFSVCSEPFFTYLSYRGMLCCARSQWVAAAVFFSVAGLFRSNGFMLAGYIVWGLLIQPFLDHNKISIVRVLAAGALAALTCAAFVLHQWTAYASYCMAEAGTDRPWCNNFPPFIYPYVQEKYWNVGFLRYWTLSQLPNILLATPILALLYSYSLSYIHHALLPSVLTHPILSRITRSSKWLTWLSKNPTSPLMNASIAPHALHSFILASILLFSAHTQIALRLAASLPFTYWAAARLLVEYPRIGKWWVGWSIIWGSVSIVLWAVFLPPA